MLSEWELIAVSTISLGLIMGVLMLGMWLMRMPWLFKHDSHNPYRRYCKKCGQQQENFGYSMSFREEGWWEDMGTIYESQCKCHGHSDYH